MRDQDEEMVRGSDLKMRIRYLPGNLSTPEKKKQPTGVYLKKILNINEKIFMSSAHDVICCITGTLNDCCRCYSIVNEELVVTHAKTLHL